MAATIRTPKSDLIRLRQALAQHRVRTTLIGALAVVVLLVGTALALGGSTPGSKTHTTLSATTFGASAGHARAGAVTGLAPGLPGATSGGSGEAYSSSATAPVPAPAVVNAPQSAGSSTTSGGTSVATTSGSASVADAADSSGSSLTATRIVKTGSLQVRVAKGEVQSAVNKLTAIATTNGGYVSTSQTNSGLDPEGQVTIRVPVGNFNTAVSSAEALGHVVELSTNAHDVTGKYVDLNAQEHALERTRSTYLTILAKATTIGATLAVQQRVDDVQQQIDELHGEIKVLANQSSYSTLSVDVTQTGSPLATTRHHRRHGISKAWHTAISRFDRGIDAIVGALGPLLLALILLGLITLVVRLAYRGGRRTAS